MQNVQMLTIDRGDNQLIATPKNIAGELHCVAGNAVLRNHSQNIRWPLRTGLTLRLRPGVVYRLDARTPVRLELALNA